MIFLDTSALLKRYVQEDGSDIVREAIESEAELSVSVLTYVEIHSALSRRVREKSIEKNDRDKILKEFEIDWLAFGKVPVDDPLLKRAGTLCLDHPIRALDALQLAAALILSENQEEPIVFMTADERLQAAARKEHLKISL